MYRSENAGMSNDSFSEKLKHRKSKVSCATYIVAGLVGSKGEPKQAVSMYKPLIFGYCVTRVRHFTDDEVHYLLPSI